MLTFNYLSITYLDQSSVNRSSSFFNSYHPVLSLNFSLPPHEPSASSRCTANIHLACQFEITNESPALLAQTPSSRHFFFWPTPPDHKHSTLVNRFYNLIISCTNTCHNPHPRPLAFQQHTHNFLSTFPDPNTFHHKFLTAFFFTTYLLSYKNHNHLPVDFTKNPTLQT